MNKDNPWTIEPWHIRVSLRKMNVHVLNDDSIKLPDQPISGPDLTLEGKSFVVFITVSYVYFLFVNKMRVKKY
jgi:large subunit ribosomal protein L9